MKLTILILSLLAAPLSSLPAGVIDYCPQPDALPGWTFEFEPEVYMPDNLHQYINGEAVLYIKYKFVEMATASYAHRQQPSLTFTVDIYDMGTPLDAFGVYSIRRRPGMTFAAIGEEATISEMMVRFWKGRFYVQVVAGAVDSLVSKAIKTTAEQIAALLPSAPKPKILNFLPSELQKTASLRYIIQSYQGIAEAHVLEAEAQMEDAQCTVFIIFCESQKSAKNNLHILLGQEGILAQRRGTYIAGVRGWQNKETAAQILDHIVLPPQRD